jgi:hypothetical protein
VTAENQTAILLKYIQWSLAMKRFFSHKLLFVIVLIALVVSAFAPMERAAQKHQKSRAPRMSMAQSTADVYLVEIIVLNLFNIDLNAGTYSMDFYLF